MGYKANLPSEVVIEMSKIYCTWEGHIMYRVPLPEVTERVALLQDTTVGGCINCGGLVNLDLVGKRVRVTVEVLENATSGEVSRG